jgi:hypothetical protein
MSSIVQLALFVLSIVAFWWCIGYITGQRPLLKWSRRERIKKENPFAVEILRVRDEVNREINRQAPRVGASRSSIVLSPGERVIPLPQVGGVRKPQVPARGTCSHWPRDEVRLSDGSLVAYICRRCGRDWANEEWVTSTT